LRTSFEGYDVIAALECLYYLTSDEQEAILEKAAREHAGKSLFLSSPIIGENDFRKYFTHEHLMSAFARHRMTVVSFRNLSVYRRNVLATLAAIGTRIAPPLLDSLPPQIIYQRLYKLWTM
jgi:hypothetical protein